MQDFAVAPNTAFLFLVCLNFLFWKDLWPHGGPGFIVELKSVGDVSSHNKLHRHWYFSRSVPLNIETRFWHLSRLTFWWARTVYLLPMLNLCCPWSTKGFITLLSQCWPSHLISPSEGITPCYLKISNAAFSSPHTLWIRSYFFSGHANSALGFSIPDKISHCTTSPCCFQCSFHPLSTPAIPVSVGRIIIAGILACCRCSGRFF